MSADMDAPAANGSQAAQRRWARVRYENAINRISASSGVTLLGNVAVHMYSAFNPVLAVCYVRPRRSYCFQKSNADMCRQTLVKSCWFAWHLNSPTAKATQALQTPDTQATLLESSCGMCMLCLKRVDDWVADNTTQRLQGALPRTKLHSTPTDSHHSGLFISAYKWGCHATPLK